MDAKRMSVSPLAMVLVGTLATSLVTAGAVAAGDEQVCHQQRDDLFLSLEKEREAEMAKVERALQATADEAEKAQVRHDGEQIWQIEERMRSVAEQMWRDCVQHARGVK